jgi:signal transduction histidine kinase
MSARLCYPPEYEFMRITNEIFPCFFLVFNNCTTKGTGTGFGLAIARQIVQAHEGRIHCKSRSGAGATFYIELPLAEQRN